MTETERLSKHILELQADKSRLIDRNRRAREIINSLYVCLNDFPEDEIEEYKQYLDEAEQFMKEKEL